MTDKEMVDKLEELSQKVAELKGSIEQDLMEQQTIKEVIKDYFNVTNQTFDSNGRHRDTEVVPRHFYYFFGKALLNVSLQRLGMNSGNKDHSTVLHGINTICKLLHAGDPVITPDYEHLCMIFAGKGYDLDKVRKFLNNNNK